jgi:PIN domain nuclease of toxin-antitoxin system
MKILLDTQMLIWAAVWPELLPEKARRLIADADNELFFSPASLWEVTIKHGQHRPDFQIDARVLRRLLFDNGYSELAITGIHAVAVGDLPPIHKDPFDRLLLAQAKSEGIPLLTADATLAEYADPILFVKKS